MCYEQDSKPYKTIFGVDVIEKFLNDMMKKSEYCCKETKREFNKPYIMKVLKTLLNIGFVKKHLKMVN